jgi:hypothetical protein
MSETFPKTSEGVDSRVPIMFKLAGYATMFVAVLAYFGIPGFVFIMGLLMVKASDEALK